MIETRTPSEQLVRLAIHALTVLREFPQGNLSRQEVDALACAILTVHGSEIPEWRIPT